MGKISKKYIGPDQVGSVQIELENGLSLRSKTQDGLSTVDLLEYSASDALVVQQDLHVLATKNIISDTALGSAFNIQTSLGADIIVEPGAASGADNGGITYIRGGDSATGVAGAIFLQAGQDTGGAKSTVQVEAGSLVLQGSCPIQMFSASTQNLQIFESLDFASSYGIKASNYNLVMYTNNQSAAATNSNEVSLITGNSTTSGNTGDINLITGDATDGNSGNIYFTTGAGTGVRGDIIGSSFTAEFASASFSVKPHSGGNTAFNVYDNSFTDSVTILKVSSDFVLKSSLPFYVQTNDVSEAGSASKALFLESGANADAGGSGNVSLLSGDCGTGISGNIVIKSGTANTEGNRGSVEVDGSTILLDVVGGNPVQMNFVSGNASSVSFSDALLAEANRSLGIQFVNAGSVNAFAITGYSVADGAVGPVQLIGAKLSKTADGPATSGAVSLSSSADLGLVFATNAEISSGDIIISSGDAQVKGTGANASSGDILIETGSKEGTGTRGSITLDALEVQCSAMQFKNAADPTLAQDLATKAYVDAQISAGTTCDKQSITLLAGDISAQYVDLNEQFVPESLFVGVGQRVNLYETLDYNLSIVGGVTRLTFAGPSATGGAEALVEGDILYIQGIVDLSP